MLAKGIDHAALGRCTQWPESDHLLDVTTRLNFVAPATTA